MAKNALILGVITILAICVIPRPVAALTATVSQVADADTYVNGYDATSNYGGQNWLIFGFSDYLYLANTYIHFNFTNEPANFVSAVVTVDCYAPSQTTNISVYIVDQSWGEYTIDLDESTKSRANDRNIFSNLCW